MINHFDNEYEFLSNFYEAPMTIDGILYRTVEHYFQACKTLDTREHMTIVDARTPGIAKRMGREVVLRPDWEDVKDEVMWTALQAKFTQNLILNEKLLATGNEALEEGNMHHDNVWGNCYCAECKNKPGENRLGKMLMQLREELRQ